MSSRDRPKRGVGGSSSSNTSSSPSRATRSSSSSNNASAASSSSTSRPVRSTRSKTTNHIEFNSDEEDDDVDSKSKPRLFKTASSDESMATSSKKTAVPVKVDPDKLAKLESITGLSRAEAMQLLEASGNKLDVAVELHFGTSGPTASTSNGKSTASTSTKSSSNGSGGGSKRALNSDEPKGASNIPADDYDDGVRAPIPTRSEKLLDYDPYAVSVEPQSKKPRSVFDGFRDLQEEYNESLLDANSSHSKKKQSLASLYRPPIDLLFKGTFEASKAEGCRKNKWILLNVQNQTDFSCQCLNRDLWRDDTVKEIIRANFIFVQIYFDTAEGKKLIHYYHISTYPFIAILDPRTGEKLAQFNNPTKLDQCLFCEKVTEFLGENELNVSLSESQEQQSSKVDDVVSVESSSSSSSVITPKDKNPVTNGRAAKQTAKDIIKAINEEDKASTSKQNGHHKHDDDDLFSADESDEEKPIKPKMTNGITSIKSLKSSTESKRVPESKKVVETIKPNVILPLSSRFETPDTHAKDCTVRILYPGGERLDFCTNGSNKFKLLVSYLSEQGFTSDTHQLIERMMPVYSTTPVQASPSQESTKAISSEMSNLMITNQSRNLLCGESSSATFKELNLFPRVLLLLQEI